MRSAPVSFSRYDQDELAEAQAAVGKTAAAEKTLAGIVEPFAILPASVNVITILAKRDDFENALRIARLEPAGRGRLFALAAVVDALTASGNFDRARSTARELDGASGIPPEYAKREIAKSLAWRGDFAAARAVASRLVSDKYRSDAFRQIGHEEAKAAGVPPPSVQTYWNLNRTHPLSRLRFAAQFYSAQEAARAGRKADADALYAKAFATTREMTAALLRAESLAQILRAAQSDLAA